MADLGLWLATALLLGAPDANGEAPANDGAPADAPSATRWYAIPNFAFNTDDGWGLGARAELAQDAAGLTPYESAYMVHLFATTRGFQHHRLRYDRVGLGPEGRLRFVANLSWRHWLNDGYWGFGNDSTRERAYVRDFGDDDQRRKRYRYTLFQPFVHLMLRADLARPWSAFVSLNSKWSAVRTYPGSLLAAERPLGIDGGLGTLVSLGVLYDTREPEIDAQGGLLVELSGRYNPPTPYGAGSFGGVFASARGFVSPASFVVIAGRIMTEALWGDIPFYEMVHWGGSQPIEGFGGADTLRGVAFGRFRAPGKAIANLELRFDFVEFTVFSRKLRSEVVPYADLGVVYTPGRPPPKQVHPGAGLGIRGILDETFVGRIDAAWGLDPIREPDGRTTRAATFGLYVVFEHPF